MYGKFYFLLEYLIDMFRITSSVIPQSFVLTTKTLCKYGCNIHRSRYLDATWLVSAELQRNSQFNCKFVLRRFYLFYFVVRRASKPSISSLLLFNIMVHLVLGFKLGYSISLRKLRGNNNNSHKFTKCNIF